MEQRLQLGLNLQVQSRVDSAAAAPRSAILEDKLREVEGAQGRGVATAGKILLEGPAGFLLTEDLPIPQKMDDAVPAAACGLGPKIGPVQGGAFQHPDHQAGLTRGELGGGLAEVEERGGLNAPDIAAEGGVIQVVLQDLFFGHDPFQL